jgi:hypothetical protein
MRGPFGGSALHLYGGSNAHSHTVLFSAMLVSLFTELSCQSDIWWTPRAMLVTLTESGDRVEIYARGRSLATCSSRGKSGLPRIRALECSPLLRSVSVSTIGIGSEPNVCRCSWRQPRVVRLRPSCSCWCLLVALPGAAKRVGLPPNKRIQLAGAPL